jgi:hypothetical protein
VTVTRGTNRVTFASLHAPALYAPYPFANEEAANLLLRRDHFDFKVNGKKYECEVDAQVLAGGRTGCGLLEARYDGARWDVACRVL